MRAPPPLPAVRALCPPPRRAAAAPPCTGGPPAAARPPYPPHHTTNPAHTAPHHTAATAGVDAIPISSLAPALAPLNLSLAQADGREWATVFPISDLVQGVVYHPPPALAKERPSHDLPYLLITDGHGMPGGGRKLFLQANTYRPCWGLLNITGASHKLLEWSFTGTPPLADELPGTGGQKQYVVRFVHELEDGALQFWVVLGGTGRVRVELNVMYKEPVTQATQQVLDALPGWVGPMMASNTYQSTFML